MLRLKLEQKQILSLLVFLSAVGFLAWQIRATFEAFIKGQTTFSVTKKTMNKMGPPSMIFCPMIEFENGIWTSKESVSVRQTFSVS